MEMIDPATVWFKVVNIPTFDLEEVTLGKDEYLDKSFARVSQMFKKNGYADTRVHANSYLKKVLSLNEN